MSKKNNKPQKAKSKKILTRFLENVVGGKDNGTKKEEIVMVCFIDISMNMKPNHKIELPVLVSFICSIVQCK